MKILTLLTLLTLLTVAGYGHGVGDVELFGAGEYQRSFEREAATIGSVVFGVPFALTGFVGGLALEPVNLVRNGEVGSYAAIGGGVGAILGCGVGRYIFGEPARCLRDWVWPEGNDEPYDTDEHGQTRTDKDRK